MTAGLTNAVSTTIDPTTAAPSSTGPTTIASTTGGATPATTGGATTPVVGTTTAGPAFDCGFLCFDCFADPLCLDMCVKCQ